MLPHVSQDALQNRFVGYVRYNIILVQKLIIPIFIKGPELLEDSSQLIYQGEVTKGVGGSWPKEVTLFLFDHQLVYCKRDLLKRNTFVYRGRLNLDNCEIVDLPDGKGKELIANVLLHDMKGMNVLWFKVIFKTADKKICISYSLCALLHRLQPQHQCT